MNKKIIIGIVIILVAGGLYYFGSKKAVAPNPIGDNGTTTATTVGGITFETNGTNTPNIKIEDATQASIPAPSLTHKIVYSGTIRPDVKKIVEQKVAEITKSLTANSKQAEKWLVLGIYYKMAGDFLAARDVWEYVAKIAPSDKTAFNNLGDLYHFSLKDFPKSELNWRKTVTLDAGYIPGWRGLHELYRYSYTAKAGQADKVLLEGISKNPKSTELLNVLAGYYESVGKKELAITYFQKSLALAEAAKDQPLIDSLKSAIAGLK